MRAAMIKCVTTHALYDQVRYEVRSKLLASLLRPFQTYDQVRYYASLMELYCPALTRTMGYCPALSGYPSRVLGLNK